MPKEQINFPTSELENHDADPGVPGSGVPMIVTRPAVHVRWNASGHDRTGHVQLSLEQYREITKAEFERVAVWPEVEQEIFSPALSRSEVNVLIKALRRARDQAYGRDE